MKILRIRKVNLKCLEDFGFKHIEADNRWFKKVYLGNDNDDRICYEVSCYDNSLRITRLDGVVLDTTLLDLFRAGLVEGSD